MWQGFGEQTAIDQEAERLPGMFENQSTNFNAKDCRSCNKFDKNGIFTHVQL
jgi:hypothetical protein